MILFLKYFVFYGGAFTAAVATAFFWLFWRPELKIHAVSDESAQVVRCTLRATRTFSPIRLFAISLPVEYAESLGASPPKGFREKVDRETERFYDNAKREVLTWSGRLEVPPGQLVELSIPARNPKAISGTLFFIYEFRGFGSVLISSGSVYVPFNKQEAADPVRR